VVEIESRFEFEEFERQMQAAAVADEPTLILPGCAFA